MKDTEPSEAPRRTKRTGKEMKVILLTPSLRINRTIRLIILSSDAPSINFGVGLVSVRHKQMEN